MTADYSIVIHDNYGIGPDSQGASQKSTKAPNIADVAGVVSLGLSLGVTILSDSGNASMERTNLAAGASSRASVFKLQSGRTELSDRGSTYGGKMVVSKHVPKGYVEEESQRYDALVRDLLFLSHSPIRDHDNFVNIVAIGWEDGEDATHTRIWPVLILEFAEYGTLEDFFKLDDTDKSWDSKRSICTEVAAALSWLHDCRIVHSDVKFGNILISDNQDTHALTPYKAKLSDFGFALDVDALEASGQATAVLDGFTPPCAPEAGSEIPLSLLAKFDVFSYGLVVGRVFLNGDQAFGEAFQSVSYKLRDIMDEFDRSCKELSNYDHSQIELIRNVIDSTTSAVPESRVDMKDVLDMMLTSTATVFRVQTPATPVEEEGLVAIPEMEQVWALGLHGKARRRIVSDLLQAIQDYIPADLETEDEEQQEVAANIAYQLHLAHLIGFGCEKSAERAIYYLRLSARLGFDGAQKETYGTQAALSVEMSSSEREEITQWLAGAAINGDKACLQELRVLDEAAYDKIVASATRRKALCERSGFIFDDDFIEANNVGDTQALIMSILESGDPIDVDLGSGLTWLHYAVFMSSLEMTTQLIDEFNFPVNVRNSKGQTPLWIACLSGSYDISKFLMSRGADAGIESDMGSNPLHHLPVFEDAHIESIAHLLVAHGADINGRNANGYTPLHYAVRGSGNLKRDPSVTVLLDLGGNPLIPDDDGDTALDYAIYIMRLPYLEEFLECELVKAVPEAELKKILANGFGNWIRQMKHHRLRSGSLHYTTCIRHLVQFLHTDEMIPVYMTNHPAGFTPLHDAYAWSSDDLASEIIGLPNARLDELDAGEYGYTPLMVAIRTSTQTVIENLLQAGANPLVRARTGENVLHHCVQYNPGLLSYMCDQIERRHGDVKMMCNQSTFRKGETPLDYAIYEGRSETANFLLAKGTNPNSMRESHENGGLKLNSFRCCLFPPSVRMFRILLPYMEQESFVCVSDGRNLLHLTCIHVFDEAKPADTLIVPFINALIDNFPTALNAAFGHSSVTPLHLAAALGNVAVVKTLLRRGANPLMKDIHGNTPIDEVDDGDDEIADKYGNIVRGIVRQRLLMRWRETLEVLRQAMHLATN